MRIFIILIHLDSFYFPPWALVFICSGKSLPPAQGHKFGLPYFPLFIYILFLVKLFMALIHHE